VLNHFTTSVLPKAKVFLNRLKAQDLTRAQERLDREANERKLAENVRKDEERVLAVRRREAERVKEEQRRAEEAERVALEMAEKERLAGQARRWRSWKRGELRRRGEGTGDGAVRMVVRLGDGRRVMRTFSGGKRTEELYGWVECELSAKEDGEEQGTEDEPPAGYEQRFHFRLATAFPRWIVPLPSHLTSPCASTASLSSGTEGGDKPTTVGEAFAGQGSTVNLVVDGLEERRRMSMSSGRRGEDSEEEEEEEEEEED
jgi:FAS-associated factor 2